MAHDSALKEMEKLRADLDARKTERDKYKGMVTDLVKIWEFASTAPPEAVKLWCDAARKALESR